MKLNSMASAPRNGAKILVELNGKLVSAWCEKHWKFKNQYWVVGKNEIHYAKSFTGWTAHPDSDLLAMKAIEGRA